MNLTVVVPCFNEAENLDAVHGEIRAALSDAEILFVDDGSTDGSLAAIKALAGRDALVRYVSFSRNFGFEAAFSAGFRYASQPWVLQLDADLQFPPAEAKKLIEKAEEGFDAVFGVREQRSDPWHRRLGAVLHLFIAERVLGIELPAGGSTFRLIRTSVARKVVDLRLGTPYFLATLPRITDRSASVPVTHRARRAGRSKFGLGHLVRHAMELYAGFSYRALTAVSVAATLLAIAVGGAAVAGGAVLIAAVAVAQVVLLLAVATIARYLVRIARAQARPALYYVREANVAIAAEDAL